MLDPEGRDALCQSINEGIQRKMPSMTYAYRIKHQLGHYIWREDSANFRYTSAGEYDGAYVVSRDITERKRMEEVVQQLAYFDPLTELPNRRLLNDRLSQIMAASKRSGRYAAVMILDLDNFKQLNDQHGHLVGDLLLIEVAKRLIACVREVDTVARFGGDEFVVMLSELDDDKAESCRLAQVVAEKIRLALAAPYILSVSKENSPPTSVEYHCSASIGVVLFINHETAHENILKWADAAMYQAKDAGRNAIRFYNLIQ
jgi:diguanylate cyclase (GGDEF)-like protein